MGKPIIIVFAILLMGCASPNVNPTCAAGNISKARTMLVGKWDWRQTYILLRGMENPVIQTPTTDGVRRTYQFRRNGSFEFRENDVLARQGRWEVKQFKTGESIHITFTDQGGQSFVSAPADICNQEFTLQEGYDDTGGSVLYTRIGK